MESMRVCLVDDDEDDYLLTRYLFSQIEGKRYELDWAATYEAGLEALNRGAHAVYLIDYRLGPRDGLELLRAAVGAGCRAPIILLTGQGDRAVDLEAMRAGAADFVVKGASADLLERSLRYAIEHRQAQEALRRLHAELELRVQQRTAELAQANRALHEEIAERILAGQKLTASLREKEVLLREIHHRVKNNLQLISSLLKLQAQRLDDPPALALFKETQDRVRSLALIHDKVYRSSNLAQIDFADFLPGLVRHLYQACGVDSEAIRLSVRVEEVRLRVDSAIPCALLIHELVALSLKHALPLGRADILLEMRPYGANRYLLQVTDPGLGSTANGSAPRPEALDLQLIHALVDQLNGSIELAGPTHNTWIVLLSEVHYAERG